MKVGDKRQVDAKAGINVPMEILQGKLRPGDQQFKGQAHLSYEMVATLIGPAFKIDALTPEKQPVAEGYPTVWSWNVEAKDAGEQRLEGVLYAIVGEARQRVNSFTQDIDVSVRPMTWSDGSHRRATRSTR